MIGWTDYLDGIAARVTGQYSRLGTLLDPLVDRLLVLSGVVVCWHFELLPRWALGAARRARAVRRSRSSASAMRHGVDLKVNWLGRAGVWPVMSALFFAMAGVEWLAARVPVRRPRAGARRPRRSTFATGVRQYRAQTLNLSLSIAMLAAP